MKIIIISHSSNKYGAELALLEMVDLIRRNHECIVFVPNNGPLIEDFKKINIKVQISKYSWWIHHKKDTLFKIIIKIILNIIYSIKTTLKIRRYKPDIIISNSIVVNTGMISSFFLQCPHLWFVHEFIKEDPTMIFNFGEKLTMKMVNKYSNSVIVASKILIEKYKKFIDSNKLKLIPFQNIKKPNINEKPLWPMQINKKYLKVIIIGSIQENKNQIMAIDALYELKKVGVKNIQLLIMGTGNEIYLSKLHNRVSEYKIENQVSFLGYINNPYPYILSSDCLLVLSNFESFGRVTVEAMFCEKIIIASNNSGGTSDLIKDGDTGLLYTKGSLSDLVEKISYVYKNKNVAKKIGKRASEFSKRFSQPDGYYEKLNKLIKETVINK